MRKNTFRQGLMLLVGAALIALVVEQAASFEIELRELRDKRETVHVAILGAPAFDAREVRRQGLVFGWDKQGNDGGFVKAKRLSGARDLNGDGHRDRIAVFKLNDEDFRVLRDGEVVQVWVEGIYRDGNFLRPFVAVGSVPDVGAAPADYCAAILSSQFGIPEGVRCLWDSAANSDFKPIDVPSLVADLNSELASTNLQIAPDSAAVMEIYGGKGERGKSRGGSGVDCNAKPGEGGRAGYARIILNVSDIPPNLYIYPAERTGESENGGHRSGGAGTVAASVDLSTLSLDQLQSNSVTTIATVGIMAIGGGGGGGGDGHVTNGGTSCHHGGDGGAGGSAIASTSTILAISAPGNDGTRGDPGFGGSCERGGGGGGTAGSDGIGGPGGRPEQDGSGVGGGPLWEGWSTEDDELYTPTKWAFGAGGYNQHGGGRGGGGCGGGGSAQGGSNAHKGGGGGGGSMVIASTVSEGSINPELIYGEPTVENEYSSQMVVTFEVKPVSN